MIVTFGGSRPSPGRAGPYRELDARNSSGVTVRLLWDPRRNAVIVHVRDDATGADFTLSPPNAQARYAFEHPFAFANLLTEDGSRLAA